MCSPYLAVDQKAANDSELYGGAGFVNGLWGTWPRQICIQKLHIVFC